MFFKQKTTYEMRISDWSSDVCSSDLTARVVLAVVHALQHDVLEGDAPGIVGAGIAAAGVQQHRQRVLLVERHDPVAHLVGRRVQRYREVHVELAPAARHLRDHPGGRQRDLALGDRSEEHTSELQSLMRISYAVFCLK